MGEKVSRNAEGYPDPTFGGAWGNMRREEKQREAERMAKINDLIPVMKQTAELAGFEVVCTLHSIRNGRKWTWKGLRTTRTARKLATTWTR